METQKTNVSSVKYVRVAPREYNNQLGVLPPATMGANDTVCGFLVGEPTSHNENGALYASYFSDYLGNMVDPVYVAGPNMTIDDFKSVIDSWDWDTVLGEMETPAELEKELELVEQYGQETVDGYRENFSDDLDGFEDRYAGQYDSEEDFAREMAESTGAIDRDLKWPYTCIDWEWAARELMYDYTEINGHYFNNY